MKTKSKLDKILTKRQNEDWNYAISRNVPYGKLIDFIRDNQIKGGNENGKKDEN